MFLKILCTVTLTYPDFMRLRLLSFLIIFFNVALKQSTKILYTVALQQPSLLGEGIVLVECGTGTVKKDSVLKYCNIQISWDYV